MSDMGGKKLIVISPFLALIFVASSMWQVGLLRPESATAGPTVHRPIADFLDAQGTTTCFTPPAPAQLAWASDFDISPVRFALFDYTGLTAQFLLETADISLGTTVSGSVVERPLADGRAEVTVNLHTRDALAWAINFDPNGDPVAQPNSNPLLFGSRAQDLIAHPTEVPGLGDAHLRVVFKNTSPGAPLPDLVCVSRDGCPEIAPCPEGFEIDFISFNANATGPLHALAGLGPEGTHGRLIVTQIGIIKPGIANDSKGALGDAFPAESVELYRIGK
jgi:hypothetical protein